jgi:hypothetical protein
MTLLSIGLIPVYWQSTQALALSVRVKNTMIATNLAQEGVELTRAVRDTNWLLSQPTWQGMESCGTAAGGCEVLLDQAGPARLRPLNGAAPRPLLFVPAPGLYQYDEGQETPFARTVTITPRSASNTDERIVTSRVSWRERGEDREVVIEYHLFDWLQ